MTARPDWFRRSRLVTAAGPRLQREFPQHVDDLPLSRWECSQSTCRTWFERSPPPARPGSRDWPHMVSRAPPGLPAAFAASFSGTMSPSRAHPASTRNNNTMNRITGLPIDRPKGPLVGLTFAVAMTHCAARSATQHLRFRPCRNKLNGTIAYEEGGTRPCSRESHSNGTAESHAVFSLQLLTIRHCHGDGASPNARSNKRCFHRAKLMSGSIQREYIGRIGARGQRDQQYGQRRERQKRSHGRRF
jgi:hypothetical protein